MPGALRSMREVLAQDPSYPTRMADVLPAIAPTVRDSSSQRILMTAALGRRIATRCGRRRKIGSEDGTISEPHRGLE